MSASYNNSISFRQSLLECYLVVFKQLLPALIALVISTLLLPKFLVFLLSILVFGMLYVTSYAAMSEHAAISSRESFSIVWKRYWPAILLTISVYGICLFALVGPALPLNILPNGWLSKLLAGKSVDIVLLSIMLVFFVTTCIYVAYSFMFFWLENKGIWESIESSYSLVKGQWWRAMLYISLSNILPGILILGLPALVFSLLGALFGVHAQSILGSLWMKYLLILMGILIAYPLQTILNIAYFEKLKMRKAN